MSYSNLLFGAPHSPSALAHSERGAPSGTPSTRTFETLTSLLASPLPHEDLHPLAQARIVPSDELDSFTCVGASSHL